MGLSKSVLSDWLQPIIQPAGIVAVFTGNAASEQVELFYKNTHFQAYLTKSHTSNKERRHGAVKLGAPEDMTLATCFFCGGEIDHWLEIVLVKEVLQLLR